MSRKKSKIKIELEIARDRLEQREISRRKLQLRCSELEAENRILELGRPNVISKSQGYRKKKKKRKKKMKTKSPPFIAMFHLRLEKYNTKEIAHTISKRLKTANKQGRFRSYLRNAQISIDWSVQTACRGSIS